MARFDLPYGSEQIEVHVPDRNLMGVLGGPSIPKVSLREAFADAWQQSLGLDDPLDGFSPGDSVAIVITDQTRPTPTSDLLPLLWERLSSIVRAEDVTVIVGTGTHRAPTEQELDRMLGTSRHTFRESIHDCDTGLTEVGRSARGTSILINETVASADHVISVGHIAMHYFAGYTGGRKSILPGVAGRETIAANHSLLLGEGACACSYHGNPINDEMVEASAMVNHAFIVDVVLDPGGDVARVFLGAPEAAHAAGRAFWDERFQVPLHEKADLVLASSGGHPKDINLYQAYKGVYNAARAVKDGGSVVLAAACTRGIGHSIFADWLHRSRSPDDVLTILETEGFRLGGHKALYLAHDRQRIDLFLLSELDPDISAECFFTPLDDLQKAVDEAIRRIGDDVKILVMPHAAETFPVEV